MSAPLSFYRKYLLLGSLIFAVVFSLPAQPLSCGSEPGLLSAGEKEAVRDFYHRNHLPPAGKRNLDSVAISIHVISSVQGSNDISPLAIEEAIDKANTIYSNAGIVFFLCGSPRYISGEAVYNFSSGDDLNRGNHMPNTINIFIVEDLQVSISLGLCGYARFPFWTGANNRYIMMNRPCWDDSSTLMHELGHFYGLFHTHETITWGLEFVDGSNCEDAGDLICDTPADPNLALPNLMSGCTYIGQATDPHGDLYVPPVSNIMSYAAQRCTRFFTEEQYGIIRAVHENENAYLAGNCDFYPDFGIETDLDELSIRSDEDLIIEYTFEHAKIDKEYEVDLKISLSDEPDQPGLLLHEEKLLFVPGQEAFSKRINLDFPIHKSTGVYYLQAALDPGFKIVERTERNNVANTAITVDNTSLDDALVFPNPVRDELKLFFRNAKASGDLSIGIYRYDGRLLWEDEKFKSKNQEEFFQLLDVSGLSPGIYLLRVDFENVNAKYAFKFFKN